MNTPALILSLHGLTSVTSPRKGKGCILVGTIPFFAKFIFFLFQLPEVTKMFHQLLSRDHKTSGIGNTKKKPGISSELFRYAPCPIRYALFHCIHRISGLLPSEYPTQTSIDIGVPQLHRPHGRIVASSTLNKATVNYNHCMFVWP